MSRLVLLLVFSGTCLAAQPAGDAVKKELKLFQGKWVLVGGHNHDGKPYDEDTKKNVSMIVEGNKFAIKEKDKVTIEGTFTIDPTKKIKTIDVEMAKPLDGKMLGIYQIDGDVRKSCFALDEGKRPDGFRKEVRFISFEWKRSK